MTISAINSLSEGYYDSLTSPFTVKKVKINAHTQQEPAEPVQRAFSRSDFQDAQATEKFNINVAANGYKSQSSIIENSISGGYSPMEAVQIYKAQYAYGLAAVGNSSGVYRMSTGYYTV